MTEVLWRLWGWDEAERRDPVLKLIFRPRPDEDPGVERVRVRGVRHRRGRGERCGGGAGLGRLRGVGVLCGRTPSSPASPTRPDQHWDQLGEELIRETRGPWIPYLVCSCPAATCWRHASPRRPRGPAVLRRPRFRGDVAQTPCTVPTRWPCSGRRAWWPGPEAPQCSTSCTRAHLETLIVLKNRTSLVARNEHLFALPQGQIVRLLLVRGRPRAASDDEDLSFDVPCARTGVRLRNPGRRPRAGCCAGSDGSGLRRPDRESLRRHGPHIEAGRIQAHPAAAVQTASATRTPF